MESAKKRVKERNVGIKKKGLIRQSFWFLRLFDQNNDSEKEKTRGAKKTLTELRKLEQIKQERREKNA